MVIPTFNERHNLPELIAQLTALLEPELGDDYELIVVDDDSPDRTWELASELTTKYSKLRVIRSAACPPRSSGAGRSRAARCWR